MSLMPLPEGNSLTPEQEAYLVSIYGPNSYPLAVQKSIGFTGNQAEVDAFAQQNPQAVAQYQTLPSGQDQVRMPVGSMPVRTADFRDGNNNGIDDRDEPAGGGITGLPAISTDPGAYVSGVDRRDVSMDPLIQQLLFGLGGQGGFLPGAFRAAERTFFDEQGRPLVIPQEIAGFSPDQIAAQQMTRASLGMQQPFLRAAERQYQRGLGDLQAGLRGQLAAERRGLSTLRRGLGRALGTTRRATSRFGTDLDELNRLAEQSEARLGQEVDAATGTLRGGVTTLGGELDRALRREQEAIGTFGGELGQSLAERRAAISGLTPGLGRQEQQLRSAIGGLERRLGGSELASLTGVRDLSGRLGESEARLRGTTGGFDPRMTSAFYDPFEDRVVQQTIQDVMEAGDIADVAQRARDIQTGGQSAFGSRARLSAAERREALGEGLADRLAQIRSGGFQTAQQAAMSEFARQLQAERDAATGLASLAGQRFTAGESLADRLGSGATTRFGAERTLADQLGSRAQLESAAGERMADALGDAAQRRLAAQQRFSQQIASLGGQRFGATKDLSGQEMAAAGARAQAAQNRQAQMGRSASQRLAAQRQLAQQQGQTAQSIAQGYGNLGTVQGQIGRQLQQGRATYGQQLTGLGQSNVQAIRGDIAALQGIGGQAQGLRQNQLDAQRQALLQAQQAPLAQFQSLLPFVTTAGQQTGPSAVSTSFAPRPSALQAGLGTGLAALGAMGNFYGAQQTAQQNALTNQALLNQSQPVVMQPQPVSYQPQPYPQQFYPPQQYFPPQQNYGPAPNTFPPSDDFGTGVMI